MRGWKKSISIGRCCGDTDSHLHSRLLFFVTSVGDMVMHTQCCSTNTSIDTTMPINGTNEYRHRYFETTEPLSS